MSNTITELTTEDLQLVKQGLSNILSEINKPSQLYGLCAYNFTVNYYDDLFYAVDYYMLENLPVRKFSLYSWPRDDKQSRINWLKTHIQKIETELKNRT